MAAVWRLPVVFFCENNQVGLSTDIMDVMASDEMGKVLPRAQGYGDALPSDRRLLLRRSTDGSGQRRDGHEERGPRPASLVVVHSPLSTSPLRPPSPPCCCSW